jgi:hypothetical protein
MASKRQKLIKSFIDRQGDPFGRVGNLSAGTRIKRGRTGRITEDDPRWNPRTMGNRRGREKGFVRDYR